MPTAEKNQVNKKLARKPLKNLIIYSLVSEWPLTVRKIYNRLKSNNGIDVTYQAVFKTVKELVDKDVLVEKDKKYMINIGWINMVRDIADMMKKKYLSASNGESHIPRDVYFPDPRVSMFLSETGKNILDYFRDKKEIIEAGHWDFLKQNYLDRQSSINTTARLLTENGIAVIAAQNLHHY